MRHPHPPRPSSSAQKWGGGEPNKPYCIQRRWKSCKSGFGKFTGEGKQSVGGIGGESERCSLAFPLSPPVPPVLFDMTQQTLGGKFIYPPSRGGRGKVFSFFAASQVPVFSLLEEFLRASALTQNPSLPFAGHPRRLPLRADRRRPHRAQRGPPEQRQDLPAPPGGAGLVGPPVRVGQVPRPRDRGGQGQGGLRLRGQLGRVALRGEAAAGAEGGRVPQAGRGLREGQGGVPCRIRKDG